MKVISLDSFENNILSTTEVNKILSDLYSDLNARYSSDLYNCFEDENSSPYKLINLITNIPDDGIEESKLYVLFLYLYDRLSISIADLLSYLDEAGYSHENLRNWLEDNAYYLSGLKVSEFYKYINGYSYNGQSVITYIDRTLLTNSTYVKNNMVKNAYKYKVYPNGIKYSTNNTYFRNYREVYDEYDRIMKNMNISPSNFITTDRIPDIYKDDIDTLLRRTLAYGVLSDRALLQKTENSTIKFFQDSLLDSKIRYILDDEYYISRLRDDVSKLLDEFIIYFVNHLEEFDISNYEDIDFSTELKTYFYKYVNILLNKKNILYIHKITFFLLLLRMFTLTEEETTSVDNGLSIVNDIKSVFDNFKAQLSDTINRIVSSQNSRFIRKT